MSDIVYKVMDEDTGEFMTRRGTFPYFNRRGGTFTSESSAKSAIKTRLNSWVRGKHQHLAIVEYELVLTGNTATVE
jgi:hypothetical protein